MPSYAQNDGEARQYVLENFGAFAFFLNDAELGPLLMTAGYNRWAPDRLKYSIMSTNWWKQHSDAERTYIEMEQTDPAKLGRLRDQKRTDVVNLARSLGLENDVSGIADMALRYGWSDAQVQDMLAQSINMNTVKQAGAASTWYSAAKEMGSEYYVPVSDDQALSFAQRIARGELQPEDMEGYYRDQAKQRFGHLSKAIDAGISVRQYFQPHQQAVADLLEMAPDQVDLMNDERFKRITRTIDPLTGQERAMTINEAEKVARKQDQWKLTENARSGAAQAVTAIGQMFGRM